MGEGPGSGEVHRTCPTQTHRTKPLRPLPAANRTPSPPPSWEPPYGRPPFTDTWPLGLTAHLLPAADTPRNPSKLKEEPGRADPRSQGHQGDYGRTELRRPLPWRPQTLGKARELAMVSTRWGRPVTLEVDATAHFPPASTLRSPHHCPQSLPLVPPEESRTALAGPLPAESETVTSSLSCLQTPPRRPR